MKKSISIVAVAALMLAAPTFGATIWIGDGTGAGLWNTATNWDNGLPTGTTTIGNGDTVTLSGAQGNSNALFVNGGSTLIIETNADGGDDLEVSGGGTVDMNAGFYDLSSRKIKLNEGGNVSGATFNMNGGKVTVGDKLEVYNNSVLEISGGNLAANDGDGIEFNGGTIRVNGIWTGAVGEDLIYFEAVIQGKGTYEFNPTVAGEIATIMTGATGITVDATAGALDVNLDALTTSDTISLFEGGTVGAFTLANVTIMHGVTELTEGTAGSLNPNEYALIYTGGTGLELEFNVVPEPATMSLLAIGGLAMLRRRKRA